MKPQKCFTLDYGSDIGFSVQYLDILDDVRCSHLVNSKKTGSKKTPDYITIDNVICTETQGSAANYRSKMMVRN